MNILLLFAFLVTKFQHKLLTLPADGIELLKPKTNAIHQLVARGARLAGGMFRHAVAIGLRLGLCHWWQIGIDAGRRIGHMLAKELLAHK